MMAVLLISGKLLPVIPLLPWKAEAARQGDTMTAYGPDFHHYCIDGAGANRALIDGDEYTYILPSETLSREETALVFWGMLTLQASFGNVPQVNAVIRNINEGAAAQGVPAISNLVTEADLKLLIHSTASACSTQKTGQAQIGLFLCQHRTQPEIFSAHGRRMNQQL